MSAWLNRQRKGDLQEIAEAFAVKVPNGALKDDFVSALEEYLTNNPSNDSRVAPFYSARRSASSPIKKEPDSPTALADAQQLTKIVKRRVTKGVEEMKDLVANAAEVVQNAITTEESPSDSDATPAATRSKSRTLARTPRALAFSSSVPLPPSPSVVADYIDKNTSAVRQHISEVYEETGLTERAQYIRETVSSTTSISALTILYEAWCLRPELLADRYTLFTLPSFYGFSPRPVMLPDLFLLLSRDFWGPAFLWSITSFILPIIAAYFFNLTSTPRTGRNSKQRYNYKFDPLTFNIVKGLLTYVVFERDYTFSGLVDLEHVARINSSLYGGPASVCIGCGIGVLVTFYEAIMST